MIKLWLLSLIILLASCAIEVGNPHPTPPTDGGKSTVQLSLQTSGDLQVDQIDMNLVGLKLVRRDTDTRNISFSSFKSISITKNLNEGLRIYRGSTQNTGNYDRVRMYFDKENYGKVTINGQEFPLAFAQQVSFIDVPIEFSLRFGELTNINLTISAADIIQEVKDGTGQVTSYQVNANQLSAVAQSEVEDTVVVNSDTMYSQYRIAVSKVNDGNEFHMQRLTLFINGSWETSIVADGDNVTRTDDGKSSLTVGSHTTLVSASGNTRTSWRVFADNETDRNIYESEGEYSFASGVHRDGAAEYIVLEFDNAVSIKGYEFSGDEERNCAEDYEMQASEDGINWFTLANSRSTLEACELVNVNW